MAGEQRDERYHGFRNESEYHEYYTLHLLLEREVDQSERADIESRICEIEASL